MSDNTQTNTGSGGDLIATDEVTTMNGAGSAGVKVQRVKVAFGDDGDSRDASDAFPLPVKGETLTKGTQGTRGFSTQDLKDAGRTLFSAATVIAGVTCVNAEALLTLTPTRAGVAGTPGTSIAVTAGKRLRITSITVGFTSSAAAVLSGRFALRMNPTGAAGATDPILKIIALSSGPAVAGQGNEITIPLPEAIEISGAQQIGLTQLFSAVTGTCWASLVGYEY